MVAKRPKASPGDATTDTSATGLSIIQTNWSRVLFALAMIPLPILFLALLVTFTRWVPSGWSLESYARSFAVTGLMIGLVATFAINFFTVSALDHWNRPWRIELTADAVVLHFRSSMRRLSWNDVAGFRGRQHATEVEQTTGFVMIPLGIGTLSLVTTETKTIRWRDFQLIAKDNESVLATFRPGYDFDRWLRQKQVADQLHNVGANADWQFATIKKISFQNTALDDAQLQQCVALLEQLPDLHEIDLRNTRVTDQGLSSLEGLMYLTHVEVAGSLVTEPGLHSFRQAQAQRRSQGQFAFLAKST